MDLSGILFPLFSGSKVRYPPVETPLQKIPVVIVGLIRQSNLVILTTRRPAEESSTDKEHIFTYLLAGGDNDCVPWTPQLEYENITSLNATCKDSHVRV